MSEHHTGPDQAAPSELAARIARLEAENASLRARMVSSAAHRPTGGRLRSAGVAILLIIGALLVPLGVVAAWARPLLTDTDTFVATLGPLADDPQIQAYVTDLTTDAIVRQLDVDGVVDEAVNGLADLVPGRPGVAAALRALRLPAVEGFRSLVRGATAQVVSADSFSQVWGQSLRLSHRTLVAALRGDPQAMVAITRDGVGIRLAPLGVAAKDALVQRGFPLASSIPTPDTTIVIAPGADLRTLQVVYRGLVLAGGWLPAASVVLLLGGVALARRRARALLAAGVCGAAGGLLVLVALPIGRLLLLARAPAGAVPPEVVRILYATATTGLAGVATATAVLGATVAVAAWLAEPSRMSARLVRGVGRTAGVLRGWAEGHGLSTGRYGVWLARRLAVLRWLVVIAAIAVVLLVPGPLTAATVLWAAGIALLVIGVLTLLARPEDQVGLSGGRPGGGS